ncbi:hypothetical protein A4X13_0g1547 [Tilletia indica]|uniref:Uncharacterized protein n=1 Tax=Tilletia indica TaxID=43049 RepID=A0A177TE72_9BASI|nr:hypothetical protein A4X13_0g1547 [Tilletia indica]
MERKEGEEGLTPSERIKLRLRPRAPASAAPPPLLAPAQENPSPSSATGQVSSSPATQATGLSQPPALTSDPIPPPVTRSLEERHQHLAALCPLRKRIHPRFVPAFLAATENAAARYLADSLNEEHLLDILALVKVGLRGCGDGLPIAERLKAYPNVAWPEVIEQDRPPAAAAPTASAIVEKVHKHIINGNLSQAARTLSSDTGVLPLTDDVKSALALKHPVGPENPFPGPGPTAPRKLCKDDEWDSHFRQVLSTIPADTSGGPSGWSKPLLSLALRGERFREFIKLLCTQLAHGTAPGRTTLGAALLIPLAKKDGGVRPIAVCELIYRFCAKVIARCVDTTGALLPFQFGVGSSGGTEPIIRLGEHFADGTLKDFNCVMATDFSNAYNAADRTGIGDGIREHTGNLYRLASWRLGAETPLLIVQNGKVTVLQSSQGVPQGDPLSPLFFCIGARKTAALLQEFLGEDGFVVCYLDDWYIFGRNEEVLKGALDFLEGLEKEGRSGGLRLNKDKCMTMRREDLKEGGFEMLGTMIGSTATRKDFLQAKIAEQEATINKLRNLPKQDALLLLLLCVQHNLRHLLRCLKTDDIEDAWTLHDHHLASSLRAIRSDIPRRGPYDNFLFPLPLRRGGCGLPTFTALAPCARGAMVDFADRALEDLFAQEDKIGGADPLPLLDGPRSDERQRDRCRKV